VDWKLELAVVHVSDVDRAETFKIKQAGFDLHVDHRAATDTMSASWRTNPSPLNEPRGAGSRSD